VLRGNDFIKTNVHLMLLVGCEPRRSGQERMLR
jgi:hypothetical protein